ncbi:MAG: hypothetical protein IKR84_05370 [Oscillibacter sp.]|nr:hypothetical protein [Oscillibacter sp.]
MGKDIGTRQLSEETQEKLRAFVAEEIWPICRRVEELHARVSQLETPTLVPDSGEVERLTGERDEARTKAARLEGEVQRLTEERDEVRTKAERLEGERAQAFADRDAAESALKRIKGDLEPFRELLDICRRYAATGEDWQKFLPTDTPLHFLVYGCRNNQIVAHWEAMRNRCELPGETESADWKTMSDVLAFLLEQYNSTFDAPAVKLLECKPGDKFDDALHIRAKESSPYSGNVKEVLLQGIWDCKNRKTWRKCVVTVE